MSKRYTSKADIARLFLQQDGRCYSCPAKLRDRFIIEHKQPLSRGGADTFDNKCVHCQACADKKTFHPRSGATTLGGDLFEAFKTERLRRGKKPSKTRWPKRSFQRKGKP